MPTLNNFSVLPWYTHVEGQDFRRWWKYGSISPLYTPKDELIPSQIMRSHKTGYNPDILIPYNEDNTQSACRLTNTGGQVSDPSYDGKSWVDCYFFNDFPVGTEVFILTVAETYLGGVAWAVCDQDDVPLVRGSYAGEINLTQILEDEPTADRIYIERTTEDFVNRLYESDENGTKVLLPRTLTLRTLEGVFVMDLYNPDNWGGKYIVNPEVGPASMDYISYNSGGVAFDTPMPIGQYYLEATDGINTWYSDVVTIVNSIDDLVLVQWFNNDDFFMDAGAILYHSLGVINQLYLQAEVAKPEYEFEEEGDTRDGVFYPTKQISKKKYKFNFLAPEYLLDVMRFIRMADSITIKFQRGGETIILYPSSFLMTPDWEKEGDFAGVAVEFETDTVAKKTGRVIEYPPM